MIKGKFINKCPVIKTRAAKDRKLVLGEGENLIVVDSGFNGDVCAPTELLKQLDLVYTGRMQFQLADGSKVWKELWAGEVILANNHYEALFIEGDFLLGMGLAFDLFSSLLLDFDNQKVELKLKL